MRYIRVEFIRYVVAGLLNTLVTYALYLICLHFLSYPVAFSVAYISGIATSYLFQSYFVFHKQLQWKKAVQYPGVYIMQYLLGLIFLSVFVEFFLLEPEIASILNIVFTIPITFFMARYIIKK